MINPIFSEWHGKSGSGFSNNFTVVVVVRGGVVQGVLGSDGIEVDVIDFDNAEAEGALSVKRAEKKLSMYEKMLKWIW